MARFPMPDWLNTMPKPIILATDEERILYAILLSRLNVEQGTGGPFGAALFNLETGELIESAVNRVVPESCSVAHAEMCAFANAQERIERFTLMSLGSVGIYSSCEPCAMCSGAIPWAGVKKLVYAAHRSDAESVGFDEGDKADQWEEKLRARGIDVIGGLCQQEAADVFKLYATVGGTVYNG